MTGRFAQCHRDAGNGACVLAAGKDVGVPAIVVDAICGDAKALHERHGFRISPIELVTPTIMFAETRSMLSDTAITAAGKARRPVSSLMAQRHQAPATRIDEDVGLSVEGEISAGEEALGLLLAVSKRMRGSISCSIGQPV